MHPYNPVEYYNQTASVGGAMTPKSVLGIVKNRSSSSLKDRQSGIKMSRNSSNQLSDQIQRVGSVSRISRLSNSSIGNVSS